MPSATQKLVEKGKIYPPTWLPHNVIFETIMGSVAYGASSDTSDMDVYGVCIPSKEVVFPHLAGHIIGFGREKKGFEQFQQHHIQMEDELGGKGRMYDLTVFNIVKYFTLVMENNPNCIDSLFVPQECILHITHVGNLIRENRRIFLHKGCYHKFSGYAMSQLHKMTGKNPQGKRKEIREKYGFDLKFALHVVRLLGEAEQILSTGDLDLRRDKEHLKAIRRGEVSEADIRAWASEKEKHLEKCYAESKLPYGPDEKKIKQLLIDCLEHHYGNLGDCIVNPDKAVELIADLKDRIAKAGF